MLENCNGIKSIGMESVESLMAGPTTSETYSQFYDF